MPRDRQRLTLESGPKLDLAKLIPSGAGKPGSHIQCVLTYGSGETITAILTLSDYGGLLELSCQERQQSFSLVSDPRQFRRPAMVRHLPKDRTAGAGALQTTGSHVLCQSVCLGTQGCLRLAVPRIQSGGRGARRLR